MRRLGIHGANVGVGADRCPTWPTGLIGSITHSATRAICAVVRCDGDTGIGIDLESWIAPAIADKIGRAILEPPEEAVLERLPVPFEKALTLAFSAKESLFKALYRRVGRYFGFHAARLCEVAFQSGELVVELASTLTDSLVEGELFQGRFVMTSDSVFTSTLTRGSR